MSIRYERDDANRRVVIIVQGTIERSEAFAVIGRHRLEDAWSYGLLYDLRFMTGSLTLAQLRPILGRASQRRAAARGPLADPGDRSR
jgi:hypothetical protein